MSTFTNNTFRNYLATLLASVLLIVVLFTPATLSAQANPQMNYQGKLTNASGVAVPNGLYNMKFWLLASSTAATSTAVWAESRLTTNRVTVTNGLFSVMLGEVTALSSVDFNQTLYLGVEIGGISTSTPVWDGEMSPRKILGTVPAAFEAQNAQTLGDLATSSFLRADEADTMSATSSSPLLTLIQNGVGKILSLFSGVREVFTVLNNGNVGIGSSTPSALLTVHSTAGGSTPLFIIASSTNGLATSTAMLVSSNGKVSIGSAVPSTVPLTVVGDFGIVLDVRATVSDVYQTLTSGNGNTAYIYQKNGASALAGFTAVNGFSVDIYGGNDSIGVFKNSGDVALGGTITSPTTYAGAKMFINGTTGNIGIGTTTPTDKLQVAGNITPALPDFYSLGSSTLRFLNLFSQNIFASSSVITNATATSFAVTGTATSTFAGGIQLLSGCFRDASATSTCIGKGQAATYVVAASNSKNKQYADYLADGTGDQNEINAAITAAYSASRGTGGKVYLLEGDYSVNGTTTMATGTMLVGSGPGTVIRLANGVNSTADIISSVNQDSIVIADLTIDGNKTNQSGSYNTGIVLYDTSSTTIRNVHIQDTSGFGVDASFLSSLLIDGVRISRAYNGISLTAVTDSTITNNVIDASTINALSLSAGGPTRITIANNIIMNSGDTALYSASGLYSMNISGNTFLNNAGYAMRAYFDDSVITNNYAEGNIFGAIYQQGGSRTLITNNRFVNNGGAGANDAIYISSGGDLNTISSNLVTDTSGSGYAINIASGVTNTTVVGNTYSGTGAASISDSGTNTKYTQWDRLTLDTRQLGQVGYSLFSIYGSSSVALASTTQLGTGKLLSLNNSVGEMFTIANSGNVGIGSSTPSSLLTVAGHSYLGGNLRLTGAFLDSTNATGTLGMVLQTTGTSTRWVATSTLGISGGSSNWVDNGSYLSTLTGGDGIVVTGSSTIGDGTAAGGLTINGNATTTNAFIASSLTSTSTIMNSLAVALHGNGTGGSLIVGSTTPIFGSRLSVYDIPGIDDIARIGIQSATNDAELLLSADNGSKRWSIAARAINGGFRIYNDSNATTLFDASGLTFGATTPFNVNTSGGVGISTSTFSGAYGFTVGTTTHFGGTGTTTFSNGIQLTGGCFRDASATSTCIGKGQAATYVVAASNSKNRIYADYIADGTGDQVEINAAIQAAYSASRGNGGKVYLLEGDYSVNGTTTMATGTMLVGSGPGTVIKLANGVNQVMNLINSENQDNIVIADLTIDGNKTNQSSGSNVGISLSNTSSTTIRNVHISDTYQGAGIVADILAKLLIDGVRISRAYSGIYIYGVTDSAILNSMIDASTIFAIELGSGNPTNITIANNIIQNSGDTALYSASEIFSMIISGNTFLNNTGYAMRGNFIDSVITNNYAEGNTSGAIYQQAGVRTLIANNRLVNNGAAGANDAIFIDSSANQNTVTGNLITDTAGSGYAINIASGVTNTTLTGNSYSGTGAASISDSGTNTRYTQSDRLTLDTRQLGQVGYSLLSIYASSSVALASTTQLGTGKLLSLNNSVGEMFTVANSGNVGIGSSTPSSLLTVAGHSYLGGNLRLTGAFLDSTNATGTLGMVLQTTGTSTRWVATSTLGITGGSGWSLTGNASTNPNTNFIGTTDAQSLAFRVNNTNWGSLQNTSKNILFGQNAGYSSASSTSDLYNVGIGYNAFGTTTVNNSGTDNVALGRDSLFDNTTGYHNVAIGREALNKNTTGNSNVAIGLASLGNNLSGVSSVAIGENALVTSVTGESNTAVGLNALYKSEVDYNTALGTSAGYSISTGGYNTAIGRNSLGSTSAVNTGTGNSILGAAGLFNNTDGDYNTALGYFSLLSNTTGDYNIGLGPEAFGTTTGSNTGNHNFGAGYRALFDNTTGADNFALGKDSLRLNTTGSSNVAIGQNALTLNTAGSQNVALGDSAGSNQTGGSNNIFLGYNTAVANIAGSNQLSIGNLIYGTGLGLSSGAVGIGTSTPTSRLSVVGAVGSAIPIFTAASSTGASLLTVLANGNVGIGTSSPLARLSMSNLSYSTAGTAGIDQYFSLTNSSNGAVQYGNTSYIYATNTATTTIVGSILRLADSTTFGNTVRGLEVQVDKGNNTKGENTALSGFARTFGVRGTTAGDAGGTYEPAGVYGETTGTSQGNAIRGYSSTITSAALLKLFQDTSTFTGTGLQMNFGNSGGSFSSTTSKFVDFQNAGTSKFTVSAQGTTTIGDGTTNNVAGLQIGYGGICVDNDGSCVASTTGRISAVSYHTGNSDLAETYFSDENLKAGEVVYLKGGLSVGQASANTKEKVIGVVSTKPGLLLGFDDTSLEEDEVAFPIALSGRVPVKLSNENGEIKAGDELMLSSVAGVVMKATSTGKIVGIALEDFEDTRAYSDTYINQFGDDLVDPVVIPISANNDPRINDGCYYGAGSASGEAPCVPLVATSTDAQVLEAQALAVAEAQAAALAALANVQSKRVTLENGEEVRVGQIVMFVDLKERYLDDNGKEMLAALLASANSAAVVDGVSETIWERLVTLANNFVDGILSVFTLKADRVEVKEELCVDGVCLNADDLRQLLENNEPAGEVEPAPEPDPEPEAEPTPEPEGDDGNNEGDSGTEGEEEEVTDGESGGEENIEGDGGDEGAGLEGNEGEEDGEPAPEPEPEPTPEGEEGSEGGEESSAEEPEPEPNL